jgi:hypothetical protein
MRKAFEGTVRKWQHPETRRRIYFGAFMALVIAGVYYVTTWGSFPEQDGHFGFWSIMPPLVAIVLAFWTREVVSALFIGICLGGVISGELNIVQGFLIPSIGTESFALILLVYLWALGGLDRYLDPNRGRRAICHLGQQPDCCGAAFRKILYMDDGTRIPPGRNNQYRAHRCNRAARSRQAQGIA